MNLEVTQGIVLQFDCISWEDELMIHSLDVDLQKVLSRYKKETTFITVDRCCDG